MTLVRFKKHTTHSGKVLAHLIVNKDITAPQAERLYNIKSLPRAINTLRKDGVPIMSINYGKKGNLIRYSLV